MTGAPPPIDWTDVQGDIVQPYNAACATHLLIGFPDAARARDFVATLRPTLSTAAGWASGDAFRNLGLTIDGLAALGLPAAHRDTFPYAFKLGMAGRAAVLGDTGASAPTAWEAPFGKSSIHGWVMVAGVSASAHDANLADLLALAQTHGVTIVFRDETATFPGNGNRTKEHFGFDDGIGQPAVTGAPGTSWPGQGTPGPDGSWLPLALGGFLLGYPNELGNDPPYPADPELRRNGSFMVYRKLEQHVALFRNYIAANCHLVGGNAELLAAKMVGRWRSGAPLALAPERDDPALGADDARNDGFRYADDADGLRTPHLSHIRRANPRDGLPADSVTQPRLHRIIRRKMPYGPYLPEGAPDDGVARGVVFRVFNADLVSQFEMVQSQWMGSGNAAGGLSTDQDVLAGLTDPPAKGENRLGSTLPIPAADGIRTLYGLPRFVTLRGGGYFFVPGLKALDRLLTLASAPA